MQLTKKQLNAVHGMLGVCACDNGHVFYAMPAPCANYGKLNQVKCNYTSYTMANGEVIETLIRDAHSLKDSSYSNIKFI